MSLQFLLKKYFHPGRKQNIERVWRQEQLERERESRQREHEEELRKDREHILLASESASDATSRLRAQLAFMYADPTARLAREREEQERRDREEAEKAERALRARGRAVGPSGDEGSGGPPSSAQRGRPTKEEREKGLLDAYPMLKNAPVAEECARGVDGLHQPLGVLVRRVRCSRCFEWGHRAGDRECPLRDQKTDRDELRQQEEDPLLRMRRSEVLASSAASGGRLELNPRVQDRQYGGESGSATVVVDSDEGVGDDDDVSAQEMHDLWKGLSSSERRELRHRYKKLVKRERRKRRERHRAGRLTQTDDIVAQAESVLAGERHTERAHGAGISKHHRSRHRDVSRRR